MNDKWFFSIRGWSLSRPFNLHPEKWFEGYPVKSTQIFSGCSPDFFLIYKYDTLAEKKTGCPSNQFSGYRSNGQVFDLSDLSDRRWCYVKTARMICSDIVFLSSCPFPHIFLKSFLFCVLEWVISHLADYHGEKLIF